jgi:shikimate dehydrogenase
MIDADTSFFGLIGNPVTHSLSPVMHNQAFAAIGYNAVYLAFRVIDLDSAIKGIKALNFKGVSVTIPHKVAVMEYLDEVEETAATIGAVNTIVNNNGSLIGYNTDCQGALEALRTKTAIQGKYFLPLNEWQPNRYEILVNTTPIGMHPETDASPIPGNDLSKEMVVMDIVYNPLETRFLKDAAARGCQTINGVDMFVFQGAYQFELWTGQKAPVDVMQDAVLEALGVKGT